MARAGWLEASRGAVVVARLMASALNAEPVYRREAEDISSAARVAAYEASARGGTPGQVTQAATAAAVGHLTDSIRTSSHELPYGLVA